MNIALWIAQGLLAAAFLMGGTMKTSTPIAKLKLKMPWVADFPVGMVRFIGTTQLLGAIGLIVPMLTGIAPILTPIAASGLALTMVFAAIYHFRKGEFKAIMTNTVLFLLAVFVAYGRFQMI